MPFKVTSVIAKDDPNIPFKILWDEKLTEYVREKYPEHDFVSTRTELERNEYLLIVEITYPSPEFIFNLIADPVISTARKEYFQYNLENGIIISENMENI